MTAHGNNTDDMSAYAVSLQKAGDSKAWITAKGALDALLTAYRVTHDETSAQRHSEEIEELFHRFLDLAGAITVVPLFLREKTNTGELTSHKAGVAAIEYLCNFHAHIYSTLVRTGVVRAENMESVIDMSNDIDEAVRKQMAHITHLQALIIEIFCAGNVTFSPEALPPDLYNMVMAEMKERGVPRTR